ncbi:MAG: 30S ribosomal protein S18 [Gammaproteobacteria bacterium]|nr:30S ribosomal protein S18 [Gammaproteobacteria bacterium]
MITHYKRKKFVYSKLPVESNEIDYKNIPFLKNHLMESGKIIPSRITRVSAKQQRKITLAIKQARFLAFLPYCDHHGPA